MFSWYPPEMGKYFATAFRRIYARYRSKVRAHSQAISRTLYRGRTVVPRGHRALRQDTQGAHLPGWLVSPLRWAALPRLRLCLRHPALLDLLPVGLVPQPYTRNWTQPYTRNLTRLYTRNQLSHTRELNSAIHAKCISAIHATRQCFGHSFDEHMFAVCYNYNMSRWSWVHACSALGSCRSCARRCHASVTGVYLALGNVLRLVVS